MLWESHSFRSDTTILKIAAHQWIMSHGLASLQAEKTKSLPKWTMWWCGTVVWLSERLWKRWTSALFRHISILTEDLAMKRVAVKFVPKLLMAEQKQLCVEVSQDMLDSLISLGAIHKLRHMNFMIILPLPPLSQVVTFLRPTHLVWCHLFCNFTPRNY
jgi:hypothetical protein